MPAGPCPGRSFPAPGFPERRGGPSPHLGDAVMGLLLPPPADGTCPLAPQGGAPSDLPLPAERCCGGEGEDGRKEGSGSIAPPHSSTPADFPFTSLLRRVGQRCPQTSGALTGVSLGVRISVGGCELPLRRCRTPRAGLQALEEELAFLPAPFGRFDKGCAFSE